MKPVKLECKNCGAVTEIKTTKEPDNDVSRDLRYYCPECGTTEKE